MNEVQLYNLAAAAMMLQGMTTQYLVRRTHQVRAGETILVHAAAEVARAAKTAKAAVKWIAKAEGRDGNE